MYLTINRFRVKLGQEAAFEAIWTGRDTHLPGIEGFVAFTLFRGQTRDDHTVFLSHSLWQSRAAFEAWTRSDAFKAAHRGAGAQRHLYLEAPELECFNAVQHIGA